MKTKKRLIPNIFFWGFFMALLGVSSLPGLSDAKADSMNSRAILFILDGSGSMWGQIEGEAKIAIAKQEMANLIKELPDDVEVGLQVYGHRSKGDCNDIELLSSVGQHEKATLIQQIQAIQPKGKTPITASFEMAGEELKEKEDETTVVLISDGKETCERDPCALVRVLRDQGIKIRVHVVGFDVTQEERNQLYCIAEAGGGKYFSAKNTQQLKKALTEVKREVVLAGSIKEEQVQQEPKKEVVKEKRIKIGVGRLGWIDIPTTTEHVQILDANGQDMGEYSKHSKKPVQVSPGTYSLKFPNFTLEEIVVKGGQKLEVAKEHLGWIDIPTTTEHVQILDANGQDMGEYSKHSKEPEQVPPGTYSLKFPNFTAPGIVVSPGQKVIVE